MANNSEQKMLTFKEALTRIESSITPLSGSEQVSIVDALGRVRHVAVQMNRVGGVAHVPGVQEAAGRFVARQEDGRSISRGIVAPTGMVADSCCSKFNRV